MAKKATTGVPTRRKRTEEEEGRRTYLSRAEREARMQRWVLLGIGGSLAVILVILLVGIVYEGLIYPNQPVAAVNGQTITTSQFQARVSFERWQLGRELLGIASFYGVEALTDQSSPFYQQFLQLQPGQEDLMGAQVLNEMIQEILLREQAEAMGITVDEAEVEQRVQEFFGYDPDPQTPTPTVEPTQTPTPIVSPTPSATPSPSPTPEEPEATATASPTPLPTVTPQPTLTADEEREQYEENVDFYFSEGESVSGMSEADIRAMFEVEVLREMLRDQRAEEVARIQEQANARHILVETEQQAEDIMTALQEGESFTELARYASTDTGSARNGGELGWAGLGQYVEPFEDAVFNGEIGAIIGPVESEFGYHIVQVHERGERELTDAQYDNEVNTAFNEWLSGLQSDAEIERYDYVNRVPDEPTLLEMGFGSLAQ